jgi:hypothetical protein
MPGFSAIFSRAKSVIHRTILREKSLLRNAVRDLKDFSAAALLGRKHIS